MLTKGDANPVHDRGLYHGHKWIGREHIMGRAFGYELTTVSLVLQQSYIPCLGMVTIWMNDFPMFKYLLIGTLGLFVVVNRE